MQSTHRLLVIALLSVLAAACNAPTSEATPALDVTLADSTDGSGKADALNGRTLRSLFTEVVYLEGEHHGDSIEVTDVTDTSMTVTGPAIAFGPIETGLEITVESDAARTQRMLLAHRLPGDESWTAFYVDGATEYYAAGAEEPISLDAQMTYYESIRIDPFAGAIELSGEDLGGRLTAPIELDRPGEREWAVFVFPVDTDWVVLEGTHFIDVIATCDGGPCTAPAPGD